MVNYPVYLPGPFLCDTAMVLREQSVKDSKYAGRIFYLQKKVGSVDYVSRSEADNYKQLGMSIVVNYEDASASWTAGGYQIGLDRGNWSADQLDAAGLADIPVVYMSADFRPANQAEMDAVMECLRGFQDSRLGARGRGIYGFAPTMREAKSRGLADYFWMCGDGAEMFVNMDWQSGRRTADLMHVNIWQQNNFQEQIDGVPVDLNYVLTPNHGQYGSTDGDFLMGLNQTDQNVIRDGSYQLVAAKGTVRKAPNWLLKFLPSSFSLWKDDKPDSGVRLGASDSPWPNDIWAALATELVTGTFNRTDPLDFEDGKGPQKLTDIDPSTPVNFITLLRVVAAQNDQIIKLLKGK